MSTSTLMSQMLDSLMPFGRPRDTAKLSDWLNLLDTLTAPTARVERALSETDGIQRRVMGPSYKAAVIGTDSASLLATLLMRLRGAEVLTLGRVFQPLLSENRITDLPEWKNVWMSYLLAKAQLVEEIGARYASPSQLSSAAAAPEKSGPFDLILVTSADYPPMLTLARKLADGGVLIDLTLGAGAMEFWIATPTPCLLAKHQVRYEPKGDDPAHAERAVRDLALADALYPGWLARLLANSNEASRAIL